MVASQLLQRRFIDLWAIALPIERGEAGVWHEAEPLEIFEQRPLELRAAADAVVILDAEVDTPVQCARDAPHVDRVHDVPEVQVPCRRGSEARQRWDRPLLQVEARADH